MDDVESSAETLCVGSRDEEEREPILRACHRHPLKPISLKLDQRACDICRILLPQEESWGCTEEDCHFSVHNTCLHCLPEIVQLKHDCFFLRQLEDDYLHLEFCIDCKEYFLYDRVAFKNGHNSREFLCIRCCLARKLRDDNSSLRVPATINHFFHRCELELVYSPSTTCNACFLNHHYLSYRCNGCSFFLDFECARLPQLIFEDDSNRIHHFCHWHPLQPFPDGEFLCKLCESSSSSSITSDSFYGCSQCQFYAHKSCMNFLPPVTKHPSLFNQRAVLLTVPSYMCPTCGRACSGLTFYSLGENFCVKCILWPRNQFDGCGGFESIHHWHELTIREVDEVCCFMCGKNCSGLNYECKKCHVYFHKSCAELPREVQHPMHPEHPLTLTALDTSKEVKCKLCLQIPSVYYRYNRHYRCESCSFSLDSHCASCLSSIRYQGHPHLLCVVEKSSKYEARCAECDFGIPLLRGPLPCKVKDPLHAHSLTLQEYYVEDNMSDEFACHICERKRNPREPVYICTQGCLMTCEMKCMLREVAASLRGERGLIELDTCYPKVACKMITGVSSSKEITGASSGENVHVFSLKELIKLANLDSDSELIEEGNNKLSSNVSHHRSRQSDHDGSKYPYTRKDLKNFIKEVEGNQGTDFDWDKEFEDIFSQLEGSSIGGDYLLPNILDSVYSNFFAKHTLFGPECELNHDRRRLIVFYICSVLHDMRMTKLVDVSAERITRWLSALKAVRAIYRCNGLDLDFLFKHVIRIAEDHYMVRAVNIIENTFSKLCKKKKYLSARRRS